MANRNIPLGHIPMDPGERDRLVVIQQLSESVGGSGFPVETWSTLATVAMYKKDQKGSERFTAGQLTGRAYTMWEMGYRADCDPELIDVVKKRRLLYQDRVYDIEDASQIGRKDGIEFVTLSKIG